MMASLVSISMGGTQDMYDASAEQAADGAAINSKMHCRDCIR
jgi:hypothetical protein